MPERRQKARETPSAEAEQADRDNAEEKAAGARARPAQRQSKPIETMPERRQ